MREWRRRALRTVSLLLGTLAGCAIGLIALDSSGEPWRARIFRGLWNALNLVSTLGDFTTLDQREKIFMMATMVVFVTIGGYALSSLTGIFSSGAVMARQENKNVENKLNRLANHVVVIGFGPLGRRVSGRLQESGEQVLVIERSDDLSAQASSLGFLVVQGDAGGDDAVFDHSRIEHAKALVVTTDDLDRKLSIILMARSHNPRLRIAVTGIGPRAALLHSAGASEVVIPEDLIAGALVDRLDKGT